MLKSWNIQNLTALFNPAGMAWIREGSDVTTSLAQLFLALLWNTTGARSPGHRHTPPLTHHLTGLLLTTSPISYTVSAVGTLLQPSFIPLSHKKHTPLHLLTYLQLHSSAVTRAGDTIFFCSSLLFPFLCFALGKLLTVIVYCVCSFWATWSHTHTHIRTLAHSHAQYQSFFFSILQIKLFPVKHLRRKHQRSKSSQIC